MKIKLTSDEYDELKRMHKKSRDSRERDKIKAISMLSDGYTATHDYVNGKLSQMGNR